MRNLIGVLFFLTSLTVFAGQSSLAKTEKPVTGLMHKFLGYMQALRPYIASEKKMTDPANDAEIKTYLKGLSEAVKTAKHEPKLQKPMFKVSREALEEHIYETERVFKVGNKTYARMMLQSTLSVCMSCHTQIPTASKNFESLNFTDQLTPPFDQAEFLFATRQFDKAHELYDKAIRGFPENKLASYSLEDAIERQVAYFSRIKRDPSGGRDYLQSLLKQKKLPVHITKNVEAWAALFNEWSREKTPDMKTISEADLKKYVTKSLKPELWDKMVDANNPRVMTHLKISGLLYEYLTYHPQTELMPEILYWLAQCDRALNNNFFYSLADMYLRECITNYPKHPIALNCYQDYEDATIAGYTGSSGVNVPTDVLAELNKMKAQMQKARQVGGHD
jgi:tetratricopeptide (TPR) repeat protein